MSQSNPNSRPGWQGSLQLSYRYQRAKTQAIESHGIAPLKVQRSFYPEGEAIRLCHNTILHTAGGIVGGDKLQIAISTSSEQPPTANVAESRAIVRANQFK